jgi:hypothetical protein
MSAQIGAGSEEFEPSTKRIQALIQLGYDFTFI